MNPWIIQYILEVEKVNWALIGHRSSLFNCNKERKIEIVMEYPGYLFFEKEITYKLRKFRIGGFSIFTKNTATPSKLRTTNKIRDRDQELVWAD